MRWFILLILIVVGFFAYQNWPAVTSYWNDTATKLNLPLPGNDSSAATHKTANGKSADAKASDAKSFALAAWRPREVGGLRVDLPYDLQPFERTASGKPLPDYIHVECYKAESGLYKVGVAHGKNTILRGGLMLGWADAPLGMAADRLKMDVISKNTATALLNGFRARRSDLISRSSPRVRARCLLLERGDQAWFLEYHAPETDPDAERAFLQMANSAQTL